MMAKPCNILNIFCMILPFPRIVDGRMVERCTYILWTTVANNFGDSNISPLWLNPRISSCFFWRFLVYYTLHFIWLWSTPQTHFFRIYLAERCEWKVKESRSLISPPFHLRNTQHQSVFSFDPKKLPVSKRSDLFNECRGCVLYLLES